jgi:hypothetical protein
VPEIRFTKTEELLLLPNKLAKFVSLHSKSGEYMCNMFSEQFGYGHREILLKYCGLDFSTQLLGNLQHGVVLDHLNLNFKTPKYFGGRKSAFWVYSTKHEKLGRTMGNDNVTAIGAPWLYLRDSIGVHNKPTMTPENILVMPGHTAGPYASGASVSQKRERAKAFRQIVGGSNATVCLHSSDYCDPDTTEAFLDEGFRVICVGSSTIQPIWSEAGNRIRSLHKLMKLMESHTHLLTDRYGSHLFYAINMGLKIGIFPEINQYVQIRDLSGRKEKYDDSFYENEELIYLRKTMPDGLNQFTDSYKYTDIANEVLGRDAVKSPTELLATLDYRKNVYPISKIQPW